MQTVGAPYRKSSGIEGQFDALVIGSGMGGLSAASLLAQNGRRVLVLEQHNVIGGLTQSYTRKGYRWSVGLHYIGDVGSPQTTTWKLFDTVTGGAIEWAPLPSIYNRMVIGERRYDIPAGAAEYAAALKSYFPGQASAIDRYLDLVRAVSKSSAGYFAQKALPQSRAADAYDRLCGTFHDYSDRLTIDVLRELTDDPELIAVICANWGDYSLEPSKSSFAMHCMLAKHYLNGGHYPVGGGAAFGRAIVPIIEAAGGVVLHGAEVAEIMVDRGRTTGVRLASGEVVACPLVISNAGVHNTFGRLLPADVRTEAGLDGAVGQVVESYTVVGANIGFNRPAQELGFDGSNIWAHPSNDFEANLAAHRRDFAAPFPWTFTTFPSAKDPSFDAECPGKSTVEMYGYTDFRHFEKWAGSRWMKRGEDYLALKNAIKERLLAELFRHVPAARSALDYVEISTPLSYETFVKRERGGFMGIESSPQRFRQSWLRAATPIDGLFLSGQDVTTDGVIGALVGGVLASSAVLGRDLMRDIQIGSRQADH
ncbi:NAD(P)/FAD-dependent oxidoreductase [Bradyrhizobium sp. 192]|uniref:phytoene desaturase family protein n=1 Tax=Bradyrhizobium sp. 192 TaxID=2782660 RepID=UPI001FFF2289|nr:NAD(P)/FAD-dependent oxidoreductase [Bradyrhizobium sp. 192]UPJ59290.1 NAD(P)/FAD-dependent oxidoreductase [Bradyrhizobium sp. 192]